MNYMKLIIILTIIGFCISHSASAVLLIQEFNVSGNKVISTTAPGRYWRLSGTIADLSGFSGTTNPYSWASWQNYTVSVSEGVLTAEINATSPRLQTDSNAYSLSMDTYRYLELEFSREAVSGEGKIYFRKNGNSIATSGQNALFSIKDEEGSSTIKFIFDMQTFAAWTGGNLTGLGLELHTGAGTSILHTEDVIKSVRLASKIEDVPQCSVKLILINTAQ
jgi:hypothetical protein